MAPLIIVGLGNPGPDYVHTRHNLGYLAIEFLAKRFGMADFHEQKKIFALMTATSVAGRKVICAKPTLFMNESGKSVSALLNFYQMGIENLVLLHDDLDIAPGQCRETTASRAAGHNGVQNVIDALGTQNFLRLRLGIGRPDPTTDFCPSSHEYVLGRFSHEEEDRFPALFNIVEAAIQKRLSQ